MPVWHERTQPLRETGELVVVGVAQEQHPDRTRLYAAWQEYDWPIAWDPFNTTRSAVVPVPVLIDERGIVRKVGARWEDVEPFLAEDVPGPAGPVPEVGGDTRSLAAPVDATFPAHEERARRAMSALLWGGGDAAAEDPVEDLLAIAAERPEDARARFRAGVALRLRVDGHPAATRAGPGGPGDFQAALDHWRAALQLEPNQYIWRRRIQQYGPRLDKPYPFYTWVEEAQAELAARGVEPPALRSTLTPAERMEPRTESGGVAADEEPDPLGRIERDDGLVTARHAVAFHTQDDADVAMLHVTLEPNPARSAHWNNEVEPTRVWLADGDLPPGVKLDSRMRAAPLPDEVTTDEARRFSFEVTLPDGVDELTVRGYALYHVCEDVDGVCLYRRLDLELPVRRPR